MEALIEPCKSSNFQKRLHLYKRGERQAPSFTSLWKTLFLICRLSNDKKFFPIKKKVLRRITVFVDSYGDLNETGKIRIKELGEDV